MPFAWELEQQQHASLRSSRGDRDLAVQLVASAGPRLALDHQPGRPRQRCDELRTGLAGGRNGKGARYREIELITARLDDFHVIDARIGRDSHLALGVAVPARPPIATGSRRIWRGTISMNKSSQGERAMGMPAPGILLVARGVAPLRAGERGGSWCSHLRPAHGDAGIAYSKRHRQGRQRTAACRSRTYDRDSLLGLRMATIACGPSQWAYA